jgi:hypothetical protein
MPARRHSEAYDLINKYATLKKFCPLKKEGKTVMPAQCSVGRYHGAFLRLPRDIDERPTGNLTIPTAFVPDLHGQPVEGEDVAYGLARF